MKLCMGCMNQIDEKMTVCPHCGFNEVTLRQESYYLNPGTVIGGKYIVGKALSYGGYTVTYLGLDAEKNRKVVIKEYLPSDFSTRSEGDTEVTIYSGDACDQFEQGLTTFLNEANRIQQLQNPQGIMHVYDCVAENDTGYVISEYLEGKTLKQIMEEGRRFSVQEAKDFVCRILEGLRLVHPLNIIHCDISPETIFVTNTGEIKLLDFGATRYVTTANSKSLAIILKQGFAPEEQYRSRGERGPWTDVYALGAVMYYMITGVVPVESVDRALMDELKEPSKLGVQIPVNIENALMNALNVYQNDRTPSAEIFYQELNSPQVNRIQVKKKKYETGKFPTWAKFLVAGMLCVVVGVGVKLGIDKSNDNPSMQSTEKVENLVKLSDDGKSLEEIKAQEQERKITIQEDYIFNKEAQEEKIFYQSPAPGSDMTEDRTITVGVHTSKKCKYEFLLDRKENVDNLAEDLGIGDKVSVSEESDASQGDNTYKSLYEVILDGGKTIKEKDLKDYKGEILEVSDIQKITYYNTLFCFEKNLGYYEGKYLKDIPLFQKYKEGKNGKPEPEKGKKGKPSFTSNFYSFHKDDGYIVNQTKTRGETYDAREAECALFEIVKEKIDRSSGTVDQLQNRLKQLGFKPILSKELNGDESVTKIEIKKDGDGIDHDCFTKGDTITIIPKPEPILETTREPAQVYTPKPKSSKPQYKERDKKPKKGVGRAVFP